MLLVAIQDRKAWTEVGYGLERVCPTSSPAECSANNSFRPSNSNAMPTG